MTTSRRIRLRLIGAVVLFGTLSTSAAAQVDSTTTGATPYFAASDSLLRVNAYETLGGFPQFEDVDVFVRNGVVRLTGTVGSAHLKEQVGDLVSSLPRVKFVLNDVESTLVAEVRVAPTIQRVRGYITDALSFLPVIAVAFVVLLLFWGMSRVAGKIRTPFERFGMTPLVSNLMSRLVRFVVFMLGVVMALDILGITALVGAILGTAGLVGIAIGFAFQDIIENYLAGLILSIRQPFGLGDFVRIGSDEGKVVRLTSRELLLLSLDGNHVSIPNAIVFKTTVVNFTRNPRRRFSFEVGVDVGEDLQKVQEYGVGALSNLAGVLNDPAPAMRILALGDSNVQLSFFGWVDQNAADFGKVRSEAIRLVKSALDKAGIVMPEPIYNVRMKEVKSFAEVAVIKPTPLPQVEESVAAAGVDVSVDRDIDQQIQEDIARSDEENLLK